MSAQKPALRCLYCFVHNCQILEATKMSFSERMDKLWYIQTMKYSVQFSHSVVSDSLQPHELQHARPPCPSPTPGVHPDPSPLCQWCHPTISSSVIPFSSCPQSFPASGSFQMSQLSALGGQSIGISASTSVPPVNTQNWSPLRWTGWIWSAPKWNELSSHEKTWKNLKCTLLSGKNQSENATYCIIPII